MAMSANTAASEARARTRRAACERQRARVAMPLCSGLSLRGKTCCVSVRAYDVPSRRAEG